MVGLSSSSMKPSAQKTVTLAAENSAGGRRRAHGSLILSGYYTDLVERGRVWELGARERVSSPPSIPYCLQLKSHFTFPGKGSAGQHLCFVTNALGGDIQSLFAKDGMLSFPLAKRIILHLLGGIAHAHSCGVVHTYLKHDSIFFDTTVSTEDIDKLFASDPSLRHPLENSHDGLVNAAVSHLLPIPTLREAMQRDFVLDDFGSAQFIYTCSHKEISPLSLRPPDIIIGGSWDEKVDIWTFGCLIFKLNTGGALFNFMLYQIICYTVEGFGTLAGKFFDSTCNLKAHPLDYPFDISIKRLKVIEEADVLPIAALMRLCLRLDPAQRASAAELLSDPWFHGVE
ncbi:kinase-like protein [Armillaria novae-zelandiae]|uniref:Kinase-like protein n=1 Tax=Armillaria novae-zelandiae TaxID=153914 RepID=A0AA39NS43_9AGAR|nr:kinase-like protein [Armillaria novae-zelandiae]